MTPPIATHEHPTASSRSPFTGADVCREAGLTLPERTSPRRSFDDDLWDFTDVIGLPVQMAVGQPSLRLHHDQRPRWRLVAKELILALLAPHHPAVAPLPRAYRTPLHLRSCAGRLDEAHPVLRLARRAGHHVPADDRHPHSARHIWHFRRYVIDDDGTVVGEQSPAVRRAAAQIVVDLVDYRDLFTADRVPRRSTSLGRSHSVRGRRNAFRS